MKLKLFSLIFASTFLLACDSANVTDAVTTAGSDSGGTTDSDAGGDDNNGTNPDADDNTGTGGNTGGTDGVIGTGLDGVTTARTANGLVNSVALIKLEPIGVTVDSTRGLFGELAETRSEQEIREWYITPEDRCSVSPLNGGTNTPDGFVVLDQPTTLLSAGESLILTDENGTYATLQRMDDGLGPSYLPEVEIQQGAGANLQLDIPGDQFNAFPGIAVPTVPPLQVVNPAAGENVGVDTFLQWVPNDVPGSVIELYVGGFSSVTNESIFIACALIDDGQFGFPEEVQAQMGPDFDDGFTTMLRVIYNVAATDDSMVFLANSVRTRVNN